MFVIANMFLSICSYSVPGYMLPAFPEWWRVNQVSKGWKNSTLHRFNCRRFQTLTPEDIRQIGSVLSLEPFKQEQCSRRFSAQTLGCLFSFHFDVCICRVSETSSTHPLVRSEFWGGGGGVQLASPIASSKRSESGGSQSDICVLTHSPSGGSPEISACLKAT